MQDSSSFLELFDLSSVLFLKLTIFTLQVLESFHLLLDLKAFVFILLLQTLVDLVHVVNRIFLLLQILFDLTLILSFLFKFKQFLLELFCLFDRSFLLLLTCQHFLLHLL